MLKNKFRKLTPIYILTPIVVIGLISGGIYFIYKNKKAHKEVNNISSKKTGIVSESNDNIEQIIVRFPSIHLEDVYDKLKIENEKPIFNDAFIGVVLDKVIKETNIVLDEQTSFEWDVTHIDDSTMIISTTWVKGNNKFHKDYTFKLSINS